MLFRSISEEGGKTSHTAIIARSYAIPMISGIPYTEIKENDKAVIDTEKKLCVLNPDAATASFYAERTAELQKEKELRLSLIQKKRRLFYLEPYLVLPNLFLRMSAAAVTAFAINSSRVHTHGKQ